MAANAIPVQRRHQKLAAPARFSEAQPLEGTDSSIDQASAATVCYAAFAPATDTASAKYERM